MNDYLDYLPDYMDVQSRGSDSEEDSQEGEEKKHNSSP